MKRYQAFIWTSDHTAPGKRVTVVAADLTQAKELLEDEYGRGNVFNLHNEDDAQAPRS
jgi:hypothetical protein